MTETEKKDFKDNGYLLTWLWRNYLTRHKALLIGSGILTTIEGGTMGLIAYMMEPMFDLAFAPGDSSALWMVACIFAGIFAARGISGVLQKVMLSTASQRAMADIRIHLLDRMMYQDNAFHQVHPPGYLLQRIQGDVGAVGGVWSAFITGAARDFVSLIALMAVAINVDWRWTLVACIGTPLLVLPALVVQRFVRRRAREVRELAGKTATLLDEVFHGIIPTKLNLLETYQLSKFTAWTQHLIRAEIRSRLGGASMGAMVDFTAGFGVFCVLIYGGGEIVSGDKTIGQFMAFFTALGMIFEPLRRLANLSGSWQIAAASIERIKELIETEPTIKSPSVTVPAPTGHPGVSLSDVKLAYGDVQVLNGATFTAEPGKTTAIVGASGAGKSTIFNVLTRLIDAQFGDIKIGDVKSTDMSLDDLRSLFSVVTQEALLFDETLRENITMGNADVDEAQLNEALQAAHVTDFLPKLADGLDTEAGPRGTNLSGGQRQRIVIARALLRNAPILLLDEATSALDARSEAVVQAALDKLSTGRTTLVIAHRLSTVRGADKIVVMDKGVVVDQGTHDDLLARGGIYAELHALQFKTEGETAEARALQPKQIAPAASPSQDQSLLSRIIGRLTFRR